MPELLEQSEPTASRWTLFDALAWAGYHRNPAWDGVWHGTILLDASMGLAKIVVIELGDHAAFVEWLKARLQPFSEELRCYGQELMKKLEARELKMPDKEKR